MPKDLEAQIFCRDTSLGLNESLSASAGPKKRWLLIENDEPWGLKAFEDSGYSVALKDYLKGLFGDDKANIVFIRNNRKSNHQKHIFVVHSEPGSAVIYQFQWQREAQLYELPLSQAFARTIPANCHSPLYLICTHSQRDKCCAKYGMPLYNELKPILGETLWRCSHLGGDRFAANMVCLPEALLYGRMDREQAMFAVEQHRRGRIALTNFRGQTSFSKVVQAAEQYLRESRQNDEIHRFSWHSEARDGDAFVLCGVDTIDGTGVRLRVQVSQHKKMRQLTCRAVEAEPALEYRVLDASGGSTSKNV